LTPLSVADLVALNQEAVRATGGAHAVLKPGVLESAVLRPHQEVFGQAQYPSPFDKAAAAAETIAHDHPFLDGNKRTASLGLRRMLHACGFRLRLTPSEYDEYVALMVGLAAGDTRWQTVSRWLEAHVEPLPGPDDWSRE
jgi:death-on-curing protein